MKLPLKRLCRQLEALARVEAPRLPEVSVVFVGLRTMARANERFLGHEGATDVITFDHGEILVCAEVARAEALARGLPFGRELLLYAVHGWLHLCGYDDREASARRRMHARQARLVRRLWVKWRARGRRGLRAGRVPGPAAFAQRGVQRPPR